MDPTCVLNFFTFFERILYKSNWIIFIFSWCGTHTKIRSKLVVIVTARSQKITLWGPQRTPLGILRVKTRYAVASTAAPSKRSFENIWQTATITTKHNTTQNSYTFFSWSHIPVRAEDSQGIKSLKSLDKRLGSCSLLATRRTR